MRSPQGGSRMVAHERVRFKEALSPGVTPKAGHSTFTRRLSSGSLIVPTRVHIPNSSMVILDFQKGWLRLTKAMLLIIMQMNLATSVGPGLLESINSVRVVAVPLMGRDIPRELRNALQQTRCELLRQVSLLNACSVEGSQIHLWGGRRGQPLLPFSKLR